MINRLKLIDSYILDFCKNFAHAFQIITGKTNFFLAKIGRFLCFVWVVGLILNDIFKLIPEVKDGWIGMAINIWILWLMAYEGNVLDEVDKQFNSTPEVLPRKLFDLRRHSTIVIRLLFVGFFYFDIIRFCLMMYFSPNKSIAHWLLYSPIFDIGVLMFYYFILVDPLPPSKGKVREWLDSFSKGKLVPARATN